MIAKARVEGTRIPAPDVRTFVVTGPPGDLGGVVEQGDGLTVEGVIRMQIDDFRHAETNMAQRGGTTDDVLVDWGDLVIWREDRVVALVLFRVGEPIRVVRIGGPELATAEAVAGGPGERPSAGAVALADLAARRWADRIVIRLAQLADRDAIRGLVGPDGLARAEAPETITLVAVPRDGRVVGVLTYHALPGREGYRVERLAATTDEAAEALARRLVRSLPLDANPDDAIQADDDATDAAELVRVLMATC